MIELVAATHRFDLPAANSVLAQEETARVLLVDPNMHGRALAHGIAEPLLYDRVRANTAHRASQQAAAATVMLNRAMGRVLRDLIPEAQGAAWCSLRIRHMLWTSLAYRQVWKEVLPQYQVKRWHVLLPAQAHAYGIHSFLPGLALMDALQEAAQPFAAYTFECPGAGPFQLPDLTQLPDGLELLCHLPTCMHDAAYFASEIHASGLRAAVLSSQVYEVELAGLPATGLVDADQVLSLLPTGAIQALENLQPALLAVLREHLSPHIAQPQYLELQVQALWQALRNQALLFFWLEQTLGSRPPKQFLLSTHDATVHGAFQSFASRHRVSLTLLPHSKVCNVPLPLDGAISRVLHEGLQDGPCLDLAGQTVPSQRLSYPGEWAPIPVHASKQSQGLRTLGVILNGFSANGICLVDFDQYVNGLAQLRDWALGCGVRLRWRVRVAETPLTLLAARLDLDEALLLEGAQGTILDFAGGCDLCVGYDNPTSGLHELLRAGIPVLQAECRPLSRAEWSIVNAQVAPRYNMPQLLDELTLLHLNPGEFQAMPQRQHLAFLNSQSGAAPLSHWLRLGALS
ncbi:hypothetical protein [Roseateles sp.]|uniref:hypothetical protein n=1 Tax=Roseateles sp. TaxID=1971397 RepID=UPI003BA5C2E2